LWWTSTTTTWMRKRRGEAEVGVDEPLLPQHRLTGLQRERMREHRPVVHTGVELPAFSARIGRAGEFFQQGGVELPSAEAWIELLAIHTTDPGAETAGDHRACKRRSVRSEEREVRCPSVSRAQCLAVRADLLKEEITERNRPAGGEALLRVREALRERRLVDLIGRALRHSHLDDRQAGRHPLGAEHGELDALHRNAFVSLGDGRQETDNLNLRILAEDLKRPSGVLSSTPR